MGKKWATKNSQPSPERPSNGSWKSNLATWKPKKNMGAMFLKNGHGPFDEIHCHVLILYVRAIGSINSHDISI